MDKLKSSKIKCCVTVDGFDWHNLKKKAREERTTPSIVVGQLINEYLRREGVKNV